MKETPQVITTEGLRGVCALDGMGRAIVKLDEPMVWPPLYITVDDIEYGFGYRDDATGCGVYIDYDDNGMDMSGSPKLPSESDDC